MKHNKQGMVMVYVIVFILISQIVYWGLLRLNQLNITRYLNFDDHYTARIQEEMITNLLPANNQTDALNFEDQLMMRLNDHLNLKMPNNILEWLDTTEQFAVAQLNNNDQYEQVYVYTQNVYMPEDVLEYCSLFTTVSCNGILLDTNQPVKFDYQDNQIEQNTYQDLEELFEVVENSLKEQSFRLIKNDGYHRIYQWIPEDIHPMSMTTNHGVTSYSRLNGSESMSTELNQRAFSRNEQSERVRLNYAIHWNGYLFEREIQE